MIELPEGFAKNLFEAERTVDNAESDLVRFFWDVWNRDDTFDFRWDSYDGSIEVNDVAPAVRLTKDACNILKHAGFDRCWLNHVDGTETYYFWTDGVVYWARKKKDTHEALESGSL